MGGSQFEGFAPKYSPEEEQRLNELINQNLPLLQQVLSGGLQGLGTPEAQQQFEAQFLDPAMMNYEQQVIPGLKQQFTDLGASSSSAMNQALAASAGNLMTDLYGKFAQQQYGGQQNIMQLLLGLLANPQNEAMIRQNQGILPGMVQGMGAAAAAIPAFL